MKTGELQIWDTCKSSIGPFLQMNCWFKGYFFNQFGDNIYTRMGLIQPLDPQFQKVQCARCPWCYIILDMTPKETTKIK